MVNQHFCARMLGAQQPQLDALEFIMYDTCTLPEQHIGAGILLNVAAQMLVGRPQDFFAPRARRYATISRPSDEVTTQSARAFTAAQVLAYTTAVRSGCASRQAPNASGGQLRSSEQVASRSGISTRLSGLRILAVSPIKRTPMTISVRAGESRPKRAISSESATHPPVCSASSCNSAAT